MTTRTSASLKHAFKRFVELVKPIEDVRHVVAFEDGEMDIFTYIRERDDDVSKLVYEAEFAIMEQFPELPILFHVRWLEGKALDSFVRPPPSLTYSKQGSD